MTEGWSGRRGKRGSLAFSSAVGCLLRQHSHLSVQGSPEQRKGSLGEKKQATERQEK